jgi:Cu(I)/Ag(I) efflux system membrane fusion protein
MKPLATVIFTVLLTAGGFAGGVWYTHRAPAVAPGKKDPKVLYWVDPMHPAYTSDQPRIAPDCGM